MYSDAGRSLSSGCCIYGEVVGLNATWTERRVFEHAQERTVVGQCLEYLLSTCGYLEASRLR